MSGRPIYARCPVPWCDSDQVKAQHYDGKRRRHYLQCEDCGFHTPQLPTRVAAERLWNTRGPSKTHTTSLSDAELSAMSEYPAIMRNRINDAPMPTEHMLDKAAATIEALCQSLREPEAP